MSFHEEMRQHGKVIFDEITPGQIQWEARDFLQSFVKRLLEHLEWPLQDVRETVFITKHGAMLTCTLSLHLEHLADRPRSTIELPIMLAAQPRNTDSGFDLLVNDLGPYMVVPRDHEKMEEGWRIIFNDIERNIPSGVFAKEWERLESKIEGY